VLGTWWWLGAWSERLASHFWLFQVPFALMLLSMWSGFARLLSPVVRLLAVALLFLLWIYAGPLGQFVSIGLAGLALLSLPWLTPGPLGAGRLLGLIMAPSLAALVFWFFTAPDIKYALSYFWTLAAGAVVIGASHRLDGPLFRGLGLPRSAPGGWTLLGCAILCGAVLGVCVLMRLPLLSLLTILWILAFASVIGNNPTGNSLFCEFLPLCGLCVMLLFLAQQVIPNVHNPRGEAFGRAAIPVVPVTEFTTRSGLRLYIPVEALVVWDAPLPNTPFPNPDLRLRHKGDLSSGFAVGSVP
jgi:hypothetical protein